MLHLVLWSRAHDAVREVCQWGRGYPKYGLGALAYKIKVENNAIFIFFILSLEKHQLFR